MQSSRSTLSAPDRPAYPLAEAARYVRVAPATMRAWVVGRSATSTSGTRRSQPLIRAADARSHVLSFNNVVEAHVLRSLRTTHGMALPEIRKAIHFAESELQIARLLLSVELKASAGELFIERYGSLINLTKSGQLAMRSALDAYLRRVEWDANDLPHRLFPFAVVDEHPDARPIVIDPSIGFGRPILASAGIATRILVERIDAGESADDLAADYGITTADVKEAVFYEQAA